MAGGGVVGLPGHRPTSVSHVGVLAGHREAVPIDVCHFDMMKSRA